MDEISQEPKHEFRVPPGPRRWLAVAGSVGLVAAISVFGINRLGGQHDGSAPGVPAPTTSPAPAVSTGLTSPATSTDPTGVVVGPAIYTITGTPTTGVPGGGIIVGIEVAPSLPSPSAHQKAAPAADR
jgi:hypothetical protein